MNRKEALNEYISYIQNEEYEVSEEAVKELQLDKQNEAIQTISESGNEVENTEIPSADVVEYLAKDKNGNYFDLSIFSKLFGDSVYNVIQQQPLLLNRTAKQAKFPTSGNDLYSGQVTGLNSLSKPITNAVNNRGYWVDLQGNPGSSQIVSMVAYIDSSRAPHVCAMGLTSSFQPEGEWIELTYVEPYYKYIGNSAELLPLLQEKGEVGNITSGIVIDENSIVYEAYIEDFKLVGGLTTAVDCSYTFSVSDLPKQLQNISSPYAFEPTFMTAASLARDGTTNATYTGGASIAQITTTSNTVAVKFFFSIAKNLSNYQQCHIRVQLNKA